MFGLSTNWSWLILLVVLGVGLGISRYIQRDLESPHKERVGSRHVAIMLFIVVMFFYFNLPMLVYYVPDPGEIKTLDEAISRIERQDEKLGKLYEDLNDIKRSSVYFVVILGMLIGLMSTYTRKLSDEDLRVEDDEKMISIFDEDKNNDQ
ncbi:MAG: hypothetical protein ABI878_02670 [Acidobacteriota bacterium]